MPLPLPKPPAPVSRVRPPMDYSTRPPKSWTPKPIGKPKKKKRGPFQEILSSMRRTPGVESRMRRFG